MAECPRPDKPGHPNKKAADRALLDLWLKVDDIGERLLLNSYLCRCGKWHVGHDWTDERGKPRGKKVGRK